MVLSLLGLRSSGRFNAASQGPTSAKAPGSAPPGATAPLRVPWLTSVILRFQRRMRHRVPCWTATCGSLHPLDPAIDLALCLVLGDAVALLDTANELVLLAVDDRNVVLGQLAPLLLDLAGELLPVAFNAIPIHLSSPLDVGLLALRDGRSTWQYWCGCPQGLGRISFAWRQAIAHIGSG